MGFTFMPVDGAKKFTLGDIKAVGAEMDVDNDAIQLLDPDTTAVSGLYTYLSKELADAWEIPAAEQADFIGWWDVKHYGPGETSRNDVEIDVGRGFLLLNNSRHNIQFTCAGAAPTDVTDYTTDGKKSILATYIPTEMTLGDITVKGKTMDVDNDAIQVLDPNTTAVKGLYTYLSKELADEWEIPLEEQADFIGWWDVKHYGPGETSRNGVAVKPGASFLLLNNSKHVLTFKYKSALDVTKPSAD